MAVFCVREAADGGRNPTWGREERKRVRRERGDDTWVPRPRVIHVIKTTLQNRLMANFARY
jgi:hypothetical protein